MSPVRIKVAVQAKKENTPGWPHINFNYEKEINRIMDCVRTANPEVYFDVIKYNNRSAAQEDYAADCQKYDGVLVLMMTNWLRVGEFYVENARQGIPCAVADVSFCGSGSVLTSISPMLREEKYPVPCIASSACEDIARLAKVLVANARIKKSRILVITNQKNESSQQAASARWGCTFINKSADELMKEFDIIDQTQAMAMAERWIQQANGVLEPSKEDILESARLYYAIVKVMEECQADAVTLDCLSLSYEGKYGEKRHMYPCLSYFQMNEEGKLGVCEADIDSTITSLLTIYLTGRPGFVSDPVINTAAHEIIYAHCVACRKVYGYQDPNVCSYYLRSHAEDQLGTSVQVIFPAGSELTTVNMDNQQGWACIHTAHSVGNAGGDAGCRSKLVASCEAEKLLKNWMPMWHRVTVFGDYRSDFIHLFMLKGLKIVQEDI